MHRDDIYFFKVKSCQEVLCVLQASVRSHLKLILRYKFLIVDACDLDTLYSREQ